VGTHTWSAPTHILGHRSTLGGGLPGTIVGEVVVLDLVVDLDSGLGCLEVERQQLVNEVNAHRT